MADKSLKPGWKMVRFGDVVHLNTERVSDPLAAGIERYVGLEHIAPDDLHIRSWGLVTNGTTFTNHFKPGQILFGKRRAYQRKVAIAKFDGVCSGDIYVLEVLDQSLLLPRLLPFLCQTEKFLEYAVGTSDGSLSPRTNWSKLEAFEFALPSIDEQFRFTEMMETIENCIFSQQQVIDSISNLRASFVNDIITRTNEFSKGVPDTSLGAVAEIIMGQSPSGDSYNFDKKGTPLLNGPTEFGEEYPTPIQWTTQPTKICKPGDILFCVRGSTTGRKNLSNGEYCIGRGLSAIRGKKGQSINGYLRIILEGLEAQIFHEAKGAGSTFPNISSTRLSGFKIPQVKLNHQEILAGQFLDIVSSQSVTKMRLERHKDLKKSILSKMII